MLKLMNVRWLLILPVVGSTLLEMSPANSLVLINPEPDGNQASLVADWQSIFRRYRPQRPLTSRGGICAVAPGLVGEVKVWSDRPLLIWNGAASQVNIRDHENHQDLWTRMLNPSENYVAYDGEALETGKLYQWQVLREKPGEADRRQWHTFEIITGDERTQITADLQALEQALHQESGEAIALRKAEYFAEKNLWSDALQVLYTAEPSPAIVQARQDRLNTLCPPPPPVSL
jgi:Domain of Unknown Function (DUF928)